jgi:hypothetical protein
MGAIPKMNNSAVIFDDLFGDVAYHSIGNRTKIVNDLAKRNFVLITSREYIFKEAVAHIPINQPLEDIPNIIQEGSYSNEGLILILNNHLDLQYSNNQFNEATLNYVRGYKDYIISELRFPHNIEIFVSSLDDNCTSKQLLTAKILEARQIENIVVSWLQNISEKSKNILLGLSIGRFVSIETVAKICSMNWNYSMEDVEQCIRESHRIIAYNTYLKFRHPSYKTAIVNYFTKHKNDAISDLLFSLLTSEEFLNQKLINRSIIWEWLSELDSEKLKVLVLKRKLKTKIREIAWLNLVNRDMLSALDLFEQTQIAKDGYSSSQMDSFVSIKNYLDDNSVIELIKVLLKKRTQENWRVIENLIYLFAFQIRRNATWILSDLDVEQSSRDLKIKIKILGVIGSKNPESVFNELLLLAKSEYLSTRSKVYTALTMLDKKYKTEVRTAFETLLDNEPSEKNKLKLRRLIQSYS